MTTAHDFPDISLSSIGSDGSSPRRNGRFEKSDSFDDDDFRSKRRDSDSVSVVPDSDEVVSLEPPQRQSYNPSLSMFDVSEEGELDVSRALPTRRRPPLVEEDDEDEEDDVISDEPQTQMVTIYDAPNQHPSDRLYPRLSNLNENDFRHLDYRNLSQRRGSYRTLVKSPTGLPTERDRDSSVRGSYRTTVTSPVEHGDDVDHDSSIQIIDENDCECESQAHNASSDKAYAEMERRFATNLQVSGMGRHLDLPEEADSLECCLAGTLVLVEIRCCGEAAAMVRRRLREMGATVERRPSAAITHIIWSTGGNRDVLREALSASEKYGRQRPHLLPPAWVHKCYSDQTRVSESQYSLADDRYVVEVEKEMKRRSTMSTVHGANRTSSTVDTSMSFLLNETRERSEFSNLTFDAPMTATQLLEKVEILTNRLDRVAEETVGHADRCTSRMAAQRRSAHHHHRNPPFVPRPLRPLRRRSHDGFTLAHRKPIEDEEPSRVRRANKDVLETLPPLAPHSGALNPPAAGQQLPAIVDGVDDMRRTVETDLNRIRQTLRNNSSYASRGASQSMRRGGGLMRRAPELRPLPSNHHHHQNNDSRKGRPSGFVVNTKSTLINKLQCVASSDEFVKRRPERSRKRVAALTGFNSREERLMLALADAVQLRITKEIDESIRAMVSSDGARTVSTLRAIVHDVPVVTPDWLRACKRANRLVPTASYEWPQWEELAKKRESALRGVFANVGGKIKVADLCTPSTVVLKELIRKSGGWLTSDAADAKWIVAPSGIYRRRHDDAEIIVDEKYILDCLTQNAILRRGDEEELSDISIDNSSILSADE